jgi:GWxTD domain-containing protein
MNLKNNTPQILTGLLILGMLFVVIADIQAQKLNALLSYSTFYSPQDGPYIETYLKISGNSIHLEKNEDGKYQGKVQVIMIFKKNDTVINYDKYELKSPVSDSINTVSSFIDQQRFSLTNGIINFEIQIWDLLDTLSRPYITLQPLTMNYNKDEVSISGIELVESYSKTETPGILTRGGYDLVPNITNFYPESANKLIYYSEVYNSEKLLGSDEKYLVSSYIQILETGKTLPDYIRYKKEISKDVSIVFGEFDISKLPSGNYNLVIEAHDKNNKVIGVNKLFFQRSNPKIQLTVDDVTANKVDNSFAGRITDIDTLREYIRYLEPISNFQEISFSQSHLEKSDLLTLQKFFLMFWSQRDALDPQKAWLDYLEQVNMVNMAYTTPIYKGYKTDRGRVYLKYGPPNSISESYNEPAAYPYEIWHYYELANGQRNKKFVFYTKDIVTNDFALLHSDVIGELSNYRWQYFLFQRVDNGWDIDRTLLPDGWGASSTDYYNNPR